MGKWPQPGFQHTTSSNCSFDSMLGTGNELGCKRQICKVNQSVKLKTCANHMKLFVAFSPSLHPIFHLEFAPNPQPGSEAAVHWGGTSWTYSDSQGFSRGTSVFLIHNIQHQLQEFIDSGKVEKFWKVWEKVWKIKEMSGKSYGFSVLYSRRKNVDWFLPK